MRIIVLILSLGALVLGWVYRPYLREMADVLFGLRLSESNGQRLGVLALSEGDVQARSLGTSYFSPRRAGSPLQHGDSLSTLAGARAHLVFDSGYAVDLEENTTVTLRRSLPEESTAFQLELEQGQVGVAGLDASRPLQLKSAQGETRLNGKDHVVLERHERRTRLTVLSQGGLNVDQEKRGAKNWPKNWIVTHAPSSSVGKEVEFVLPSPTEEEVEEKPTRGSRRRNVLSTQDVRVALARRVSQIQTCYERHLRDSLDAPKIDVVLWIRGATGKVSDVDVPDRSVDPLIRSCVAETLKTISFPRFTKKEQRIAFPIVLR